MSVRINKYLSEVGYCSRRVADRLIEEGKVTINGEVPEIGTRVEDGDQVKVKGQRIEKSRKQKNIYLAFNKPIGIVCTTNRRVDPDNIIDFIKLYLSFYDHYSKRICWYFSLKGPLSVENQSESFYIKGNLVGFKSLRQESSTSVQNTCDLWRLSSGRFMPFL